MQKTEVNSLRGIDTQRPSVQLIKRTIEAFFKVVSWLLAAGLFKYIGIKTNIPIFSHFSFLLELLIFMFVTIESLSIAEERFPYQGFARNISIAIGLFVLIAVIFTSSIMIDLLSRHQFN